MRHLLVRIGSIGAAVLVGSNPTAEPADARSRFTAAIQETAALMQNAQASRLAREVELRLFDRRDDLPDRRFATRADVMRYARACPWINQYLLLFSMERHTAGLTNVIWPRAEDATALRGLLADADPFVRGLAVEALATLHDPEDVPRIAALLADTQESIAVLGWNMIVTARLIMPSELAGEGGDSLDINRSWQPRRVQAYARAALRLMTGESFGDGFEDRDFEQWWDRNRGGQDRVWYWQERLHRDLAVAAAVEWPDLREVGSNFDEWLTNIRQETERRFEAVRQGVAKELSALPAEVEVKVRLLAVNRYSSALGSDLGAPLLGRFDSHRVSSARLLELFKRQNLWDDVDWDRGAYNTLVVQIAGQAERFFEPEDVGRLRAIQEREHELGWNGQASLCIGISRLLPPASPNDLDDAETRDGVLRNGIRTLPGVFARGAVARELVGTGLCANWDFLTEQFFGEQSRSAIPDLRAAVLQELASPPHTAEKRDALGRLLLSQRFEALWLEPRGAMGADQHRLNAIHAVNAYAGREVLTSEHDRRLADPAQAAETLREVKRIVREAINTKPVPSPR